MMNESKIIFRAKNFRNEVLGERHFNVAFETFEGISHFLEAEIAETRRLGRKRFPDTDFHVDYILQNDLADDEEVNVVLT